MIDKTVIIISVILIAIVAFCYFLNDRPKGKKVKNKKYKY
jgi:preprotein translocase subunit YajC